MSMPNIPDVNPEICICFEDVIKLLLSSVALQEIALSNVINAESEKLQSVIKRKDNCYTVKELITLNESIEKVLYEVSSIETLLITKIKNISKLYDKKEKECECCDYDECYADCNNINNELNHICTKYIDEFNCKCNNKCEDKDYECNCNNKCEDKDYECKCKNDEEENIKENDSKEYKNIEDSNDINYIKAANSKKHEEFQEMNKGYTYSKNPYYQNYNKISDMLSKILGRGGNKQM